MKQSPQDFTPFDARRRASKTPLIFGAALLGVAGLVAFIALRSSRGGETPETAALASPASTRAATPTPTPVLTPSAPPLPKWARRDVITDVPVAKGRKVVALTFDDGPWPRSTNEILSILRDSNIKATFFMVGQEIGRRPEVAMQVRKAGHALGGHSFTHAVRPRDPHGEVRKTDANLKKVLQFTPTIYRPPYGIVHNAMTRREQALDRAIILWSADSEDWRRPGVSRIVSNVLREVRPGAIVLMHDGGGPRGQTISALPRIISGLRARGYEFVTVPKLLSMRVVPKKMPAKKSAVKLKQKHV